jgi:hypothetical protein
MAGRRNGFDLEKPELKMEVAMAEGGVGEARKTDAVEFEGVTPILRVGVWRRASIFM